MTSAQSLQHLIKQYPDAGEVVFAPTPAEIAVDNMAAFFNAGPRCREAALCAADENRRQFERNAR